MKVPYLSFRLMHDQIKSATLNAFEQFYDSQQYVSGSLVNKFEIEYAVFNQVNHAVAVSNGLDALFLSLKALGIKAGDEVIIPSNTYIATALAVSHLGAVPVLVEPDIRTYNLDPNQISRAITKKTKAMIPVHLYGQSCEMNTIMEIANQHGLHVVEDNAQAHGATFKDKKTGSFGILNATSFYPGKNLGALGEAGCITTNNEQLAGIVSKLRNYGSSEKYYNELLGHNMRMDELQAAILSIKLHEINAWTTARQKNAALYLKLLSDLPQIILPVVATDATHVFHIFAIRTTQRNSLQAHLTENGIGTMIHYPVPIHLQKAYQHLHFNKNDFLIAELIADTTLSLPCWPGMQDSEIEFVANQIKLFFLKHV